TLDFDVCEMAITTYLTAKAHDKPFTALPVFVLRQFSHSAIVYNVKSGVVSPRDLEGKKVGVRAYTVTTGVWARGILATEYGVDLDEVTWVVVDEEHVREYEKRSNVMERAGANRAVLLVKGELAAAIGGDDPLPYGLARNRKAMDAVIQFARDQKILPRRVSPEEMFAKNTFDLE